MTIDPRVGFWFSIAMAIVSALGICGTQLTTLFGDVTANKILAGIVVLNVINGAINAILHAIPSKPNSASEFALGPKTVPVILLAVLVLGAMAFPGNAMAQVKLHAPAVTGDLKKDINTDGQNFGLIPPSLQVQPTGNVAKDLQAIWDKIITASTTDLTYASKLAASANTPASGIRKQCWDAIIVINNQANGQNLKNADGTVMAKPDPHVFTDVETLAEVVDNLSPSGPLFTACAGAAQLAKTNVLTFVNAVVTGAAGIAAMPIIPGL